jgi:hypothetical protein
MSSVPPLLTFLLMVVAGWVQRRQLIVIEFLQAENRLRKERLRGKRIRFTDAERALLARKAKAVGRTVLLELDTLVSPDTLMRWHRRLVAEKWNFTHRRSPGRPGIMRKIAELIVRMAQEDPGCCKRRIHSLSVTPRWNAQLLLSASGVRDVVQNCGHYGLVLRSCERADQTFLANARAKLFRKISRLE